VDLLPPTDQIAVSHHHARSLDGKTSVAQLIQVEQIGLEFLDQRGEICGRVFQILFGFLHPVQTKCSRTVVQALQILYPGSLLRQGNIAEADQRHSHSTIDQTGDQLLRVSPHPAQSIGGHKNVHSRLLPM
jgi:hypothetical protein